MSRYYVIQVYTGAEKKTVDAIKKGISSDVILDCFFVSKRRKKKYAGTWHLVEENCFPGYIFIETDKPKEMCQGFASIHLFARILGLDKETFYVQPVAEEERFFIDALTDRTPENRLIDLSRITIEEGQRIRIVAGPLKGLEGKVIKFDLHRRKAVVEIKLLSSTVRTDLGIEIIKKEDT